MSEARRNVLKIILADDHPIIRYGVRATIESLRYAKVVGEASSPMELFKILDETPCDMVITDFSMPDNYSRDGLYLIDRIMRTFPDKTVVVLTALRNVGVMNALLRKGVRGLIEKEGDIDQVGVALRSLKNGKIYISPSLRKLLANGDVSSEQKEAEKLTEAEIEVLRLFAYEGLTSQQIAERLNRSRKTVSRHKRNAQAKLMMVTNQELLEYCRRIDLSTGICK
jgi:two-component system capsular synthesis response regulator RcsB